MFASAEGHLLDVVAMDSHIVEFGVVVDLVFVDADVVVSALGGH